MFDSSVPMVLSYFYVK